MLMQRKKMARRRCSILPYQSPHLYYQHYNIPDISDMSDMPDMSDISDTIRHALTNAHDLAT